MELHFLGNANAARDAQFIELVKRALQLPADVQLEFATASRNAAKELALTYDLTAPIQVAGAEYGMADGVFVDEAAVAELRFDPRGALISSQVTPKDTRHLELVKDQIRKLAAQDAIYAARADEPIDSSALFLMRKKWVVAPDEQGRKRLRRALIA